MRRSLGILIILMVIMIGATSLFQLGLSVPTIEQTTDPNGSVFEATAEQAGMFIFWVLFVLGNVVVVGGVLGILFWRGNVAVARANAMEARSADQLVSPEERQAEIEAAV